MKRKHVSQPFEWRDSDDGWGDEPDLEQDDFNARNTVHFAPQPDKPQRKGRAAVVDDEPRVPCHENYIKQYNAIVNQRYPMEETDEESVEPGQELAVRSPLNLFDDLFASTATQQQQQQQPPPPRNAARKEPRLDQTDSVYDKRRRPECFLCSRGNQYHDNIEAKHVCKLNEIMGLYGSVDNDELAWMLVLYYEKYVRRGSTSLPRLTFHVALEHIEQHTRDATIYQGESIKLLLEIRFGLANQIFKASGRPDKDTLSGFVQVQRLLNTQMTMKVENMMFNFGKSGEDTKHMGRYFKLMEMFTEKKERQEREWRQEMSGADDLFDV